MITSYGLLEPKNACSSPSQIGAATARILVVDDDAIFLRAISKTLSRHGYSVFSATGPREALETLACQPPINVVLTDVMMPDTPGTDLVREVAEVWPETACILMTGGIVDSADVPKDVPILRKPVARLDLIAAVEAAITRSTRLRALPQSRWLQVHKQEGNCDN